VNETLLELLKSDEMSGAAVIHAHIKDMDIVDIADLFENLDAGKDVRLFRLLPKVIAADVFAYITPEKQQAIIEILTDKEQASIIDDLFADDAADLIDEMPANVVKRLLQNASPETRQNINHLLKYPDNSAGSIMTVEYFKLKPDYQVGDVFDIIRQYGVNKETIYTCYITDDKKTLVGVVSVRDLLFAEPGAKVKDIMTETLQTAHTLDTREQVAATFKKYGMISLPIVDSENKLVGIVTVDDVLQVMEEEHSEDIARMAAVRPSDTPYLKTGVYKHSRNRIGWLLILMISAMLTGFVITGFENVLVAVPLLMAFVPLLMDTAGNAGSQTSAQVIRAMALGEVTTKHIIQVLWKELRVAVLCGVVLSIVNFARIIVFEGVGEQALNVAIAVTLSLCLTVIIAKTIGCLLPIIAKRLRIDPANMAAPLITTIADVLSLLVYFGFASLLLNI